MEPRFLFCWSRLRPLRKRRREVIRDASSSQRHVRDGQTADTALQEVAGKMKPADVRLLDLAQMLAT